MGGYGTVEHTIQTREARKQLPHRLYSYAAGGGHAPPLYIRVEGPNFQFSSPLQTVPSSKQTFVSYFEPPTYKPTIMSFYASSEDLRIIEEGRRTWLVGRA